MKTLSPAHNRILRGLMEGRPLGVPDGHGLAYWFDLPQEVATTWGAMEGLLISGGIEQATQSIQGRSSARSQSSGAPRWENQPHPEEVSP